MNAQASIGSFHCPGGTESYDTPSRYRIDMKREACCVLKIEAGSSLKYELEPLRVLVSSRFGEDEHLVA
jgi:hypothetical protein